MKYYKHLDLDNVTIEDCIDVFENDGLVSIINDGKLVNFENNKES